MDQANFASQLFKMAECLRREQLWHDDVCQVWQLQSDKHDSTEKQKASELYQRVKTTRHRRANQLRIGSSNGPESIRQALCELAMRLESSNDDVSSEVRQLASRISLSTD